MVRFGKQARVKSRYPLIGALLCHRDVGKQEMGIAQEGGDFIPRLPHRLYLDQFGAPVAVPMAQPEPFYILIGMLGHEFPKIIVYVVIAIFHDAILMKNPRKPNFATQLHCFCRNFASEINQTLWNIIITIIITQWPTPTKAVSV